MKILATVALATTLAAPAFAGGLNTPIDEPMIAPVAAYAPARLNGEWGGAYLGAQLGYGKLNAKGGAFDGSGAIGGVHAGYRMDYGTFVGGIELDHDRTKIDLGTIPGDKLNHVTRLKLMGGYDMGRALVYATAGVANAKATLNGVSRSDNGYVLGAGMDFAVTDNWVVGGELLHNRFDNFDKAGVDMKLNTVKVKASYRF